MKGPTGAGMLHTKAERKDDSRAGARRDHKRRKRDGEGGDMEGEIMQKRQHSGSSIHPSNPSCSLGEERERDSKTSGPGELWFANRPKVGMVGTEYCTGEAGQDVSEMVIAWQ